MDKPRGTNQRNPGLPITARRTLREEQGGEHFVAPLGSSTSGRLRFTNGVHRSVIRAESRMRSLYRARFGEKMPTIWGQEGVVTIRYPRGSARDWLDCRPEQLAEVTLNARIPWDVEVRGGASWLVADLRGLRLGSFSLHGGAGRLEVTLPAPSGTVVVVILGGASNVAIRRPEGVSARVRVGGGATLLKFDDRRIGVAGGELDLRNEGYDIATDRYDMVVTGAPTI